MPGSGRVSSGAGACVVAAVLEFAEAAAVVRACADAIIVARVDSEALGVRDAIATLGLHILCWLVPVVVLLRFELHVVDISVRQASYSPGYR